MSKAYLIMGSNLGDRESYIDRAVGSVIQRIGPVVRRSSIYESEPWGFTHPGRFLNQVLEISTAMPPAGLLSALLEIERENGRVRGGKKYFARTLDIDILFYDDICLDAAGLTIPHPRLQERKFALLPLCEMEPSLRHPVLNKTVEELLRDCPDPSEIRVFKEPTSAGARLDIPTQ